ncbi:MAG: transcriptional activator NhaR [Methylophilaceae bacterium]|jgi:LysR family transcriptional activator of nhaA|uniref:transcriptional activator NhaR n=1 Tax=Methylobacillus sp. MM3 TaxID=1848039 RepID=UPI0007DF064B|nr:transcriptional activator NhaR [Methylobacillus sp. MM3]OAJ69807.1 LysR family transcriptional regulator [Methylobacillus sp. MM3]
MNYKHLYYFWTVAKAGSIARASEQLHITPQTISGQLSLFENVLGETLFDRSRRRFALTDAGRTVLGYAEEIFSLGKELEDVLRHSPGGRPLQFRVGVSDAVPKALAYKLIEPALRATENSRIVCREGKVAGLMGELAIHQLDIVIADSPMPPRIDVKAFNHLLGECGLTFFATSRLAKEFPGDFPQRLNGAPLLLPGDDVAVRPKLIRWFDQNRIRPRITGEFDDGALMAAFGQAGAGIFSAPSAIADRISDQYGVEVIGATEEITESFYAISVERRLSHPAVVAISEAARQELFL